MNIIIQQISYLCAWVDKAILERSVCPTHQRLEAEVSLEPAETDHWCFWVLNWEGSNFPSVLLDAVAVQPRSPPAELALLSGQRDGAKPSCSLKAEVAISGSRSTGVASASFFGEVAF